MEERPEAIEIYYHPPADERLPHTYRQSIVVKIFGDGVRFAQDYDYSPTIRLRQLPHGFLLKRALSSQEKFSKNRLLLPTNFSGSFVSLCYVPKHSWVEEAGPALFVLILHQIVRPSGHQGTGDANPEINWNTKEPTSDTDPLASISSFILETPLEGRPTSEIPHITLKLEDGQLQNLDGSDFNFPVGERILDIQLDGVTFPVFWHQKENSPPYRVFFFNGAGAQNAIFGRMSYLRELNLSGGCLCDASAMLPPKDLDLVEGLWFVGTAQENFHPKFAYIIRTILQAQGISESHVLFMGSSMGGFMALKMAEYFSEAHIFTYNSQTDY
ncbi:MAG: hypothetical protein LBG98_03845, partial [Puniceicoccales bacterium]|nr:hypothetical protein [Puniceicoccales bacterium]